MAEKGLRHDVGAAVSLVRAEIDLEQQRAMRWLVTATLSHLAAGVAGWLGQSHDRLTVLAVSVQAAAAGAYALRRFEAHRRAEADARRRAMVLLAFGDGDQPELLATLDALSRNARGADGAAAP